MKLTARPRLRSLALLVILGVLVALTGAVPAAHAGTLEAATPATVSLASSYSMNFDNLTFSETSDGSLTNMSVDASGNVTGDMTVNPPLGGTGPLSGVLTGSTLTFSVEGGDYTGTVNAATLAISGTYTYPGQDGVWTATPTAAQKTTMVALGDSYSSGEGTGEYYTDSGSCHRSPVAWPNIVSLNSAKVEMPHSDFLACSGATSDALVNTPFKGQQPQLQVVETLEPAPKVITLSIGGNDVHFSNILADCYHTNCIRDGVIAQAAADIQKEKSVLERDYVLVGLADPAAKILVVGYPRIFESDTYCGVKWLGLGFKPAELAALNNLGAELNTVIAEAAAHDDVTYIDVTNALQGHEMCSSDPWVVQVNLKGAWNQEEGHPTTPGQKAIAAVVRNYINSHF